MQSGRKWLELRSGQEWLQTLGGQEWLQTLGGRKWLQTLGGREWLQTQSGREWLQTPHGQAWRLTPAASIWVQMEEFSSTVEAVSKFMIIPEAALLAAFQVIQQFTSLPDFLMLPAFLAFTIQSFTSASPQACLPVDIEIIHSIKAFASFANEARERSWSTSDALSYACQNWAIHLSQAPNSWDDMLNYIFKVFWDHHLPSWLERQWCLKGLQSCVVVLSEGQKLAKDHLLQVSGNSLI
ncbi:hypothetical protein K503DRAFT_869108 [Rhizopogon vinicolor AM-OR11-026]|uniref:Uncharacterized protein n=1 Tax=Rhizopogon vinicolor AM-OR11-026 TaxID=1314800 RepID=A0A1B7MNI6_9AGAM|nr:hypothetical protein K503DRAFT_869108 [Rhizopogon vinicolor AM-OR11-026]